MAVPRHKQSSNNSSGEAQRLKLFLENTVSNYKDRRDQFLGDHLLRVLWYLRRIRPSTKHRNAEYQRILSEQVSFVLDEREEIKGLVDFNGISNALIEKAVLVLKTHIVTLKFRSDYLSLFLGLSGLLLTGGMILWKTDPEFSPEYLLPLIAAGILTVIERHLFLEKISMYEELAAIFEYKLKHG